MSRRASFHPSFFTQICSPFLFLPRMVIAYLIRLTPLRFVCTMLALLALWVGLGLFRSDAHLVSNPATDTTLPTVRAFYSHAHLEPRILNSYGTLKAFSSIQLRTAFEGKVIALPIKEGSSVKKGDIIVCLDLRDYAIKREQARATLQKKQIQYESTTALLKKQLTSKSEMSAATAELDGARAELENAEYAYGSRFIRAPADGILEKLEVEVGDMLEPMAGKSKVADLVANGAMSAVVYLSEHEIAKVALNQEGLVSVAGRLPIPAIVTFVGNVADTNTRTFRVELTLNQSDALLKDGMTAEIAMTTGYEHAHSIDASTLCLSTEGMLGIKTVTFDPEMTADTARSVLFYPIRILGQNDKEMLITGLPEHAYIIFMGHAAVQPGEMVKTTFYQTPHSETPLDHPPASTASHEKPA